MPSSEYAGLVGRSEFDIAASLLAERPGSGVGQEELLDRVAESYAAACRQQPRIPDAHRELVRRLAERGVPMAIATGTLRRMIEPVLEDRGLAELIPVVVTIEDVEHGKPDPEGFVLAARQLGLSDPADLRRVVVFEDSAAGVEAGRRAGARTVAVGQPGSPAAQAADAWVGSLSELG
jgi:HAD superfamily hydrolase (TIGR01509 family)